MPQSLGIAGVFRPDQQAGGVYAVFQNLLRGIEQARRCEARFADLQLTVFHGPHTPAGDPDAFCWRAAPLVGNRFAVETWVGAVGSRGLDAVLYPNYFTPPASRAARSVTIVHDLQFRHFPHMFSRAKRLWLRRAIRHTLSAADRVVTISHAVKDDVCAQFGEQLAQRVTPIWNPIDLDRLGGDAEADFTDGRPYVLSVAIDRPQKNLATLIRAFAQLRDRFPEHCLVLAGQLRSERRVKTPAGAARAGAAPGAAELVEQLGLEDRVRVTGFVSNAQLGALYRNASLFAMPSLFEGFGMPPVEALALGAPTLVTDLPVLREVTLGRAHYVADPLDAHALAEQIAATLEEADGARPSRETQEELRELFSPRAVATRYLDLLLANGEPE